MQRRDRSGLLTLLTDFGWEAGFVGALHVVAFAIAPDATVIDLDHSVPPGNVRLGALRLERFARILPAGAHVAVVDPGVGGSRRPIAIEAAGHHLVGPDNGLLVWAAEHLGGTERAVVLDNPTYHLPTTARTFDGRDVFVPVAAHLLSGVTFGEIGSPIDLDQLVRLERPSVTIEDGGAVVEVLQIDGFGNVQFGMGRVEVEDLGFRSGDRVLVQSPGGGEVAAFFGEAFADVARGEAVVYIDSDEQLSLATNGGRADSSLVAPPGTRVRLSRLS
jgi:S-adenosyl-L-methionine hydrolase (adenosine-forming)